jgi:hypothetical protein
MKPAVPQALRQPFKVHPASMLPASTTSRPASIPSNSAVAIETLRVAIANAMASTCEAPPTTTGHAFVQALWAWADVRVPSLKQNGEALNGKTRRSLRLVAGGSSTPTSPTTPTSRTTPTSNQHPTNTNTKTSPASEPPDHHQGWICWP